MNGKHQGFPYFLVQGTLKDLIEQFWGILMLDIQLLQLQKWIAITRTLTVNQGYVYPLGVLYKDLGGTQT